MKMQYPVYSSYLEESDICKIALEKLPRRSDGELSAVACLSYSLIAKKDKTKKNICNILLRTE